MEASKVPTAVTDATAKEVDPTRRKLFRLAAGGAAMVGLPGCALPERSPAVPAGRAAEASVLGIPNERFFPFKGTEQLEAEFVASMDRKAQALRVKSPLDLPMLQLLSISGGGENGAFGAGLLCGWTVQGSRPTFDLVTGTSTGALTAPFAFLGPAYDPQLRAVYTELKPDQVLANRPISAALWDDALADNAPLFKTISRYVDAKMVADIAAGYADGRVLLVASTDLDAQVPVIWNVGAIAASGHPKAADTIRRVLLASAAVPGAFPPTMFEVTLDGRTYQEMHIDGGTFAQTFLYPPAMTAHLRLHKDPKLRTISANAYVIRNGRLDAEWAKVERRTLDIAGRAISTMIAAASYNDVGRIYAITQRDGIGYNLAFIGPDFKAELPEPFDPGYMRALFDYAYQRAVRGYDWSKKPPFA